MKKAQVMVFVLFITGVISVISGALTIMWESEMKTRSSEREGLTAFYLAQAAVERGKILVLYNYWGAGIYNVLNNNELDNPADAYQFFYDIIITNSGGTSRIIQGIGRVLNSAGIEIAHREIQVTVTGIQDSVPPVWQDDDLTGGVSVWSWEEV